MIDCKSYTAFILPKHFFWNFFFRLKTSRFTNIGRDHADKTYFTRSVTKTLFPQDRQISDDKIPLVHSYFRVRENISRVGHFRDVSRKRSERRLPGEKLKLIYERRVLFPLPVRKRDREAKGAREEGFFRRSGDLLDGINAPRGRYNVTTLSRTVSRPIIICNNPARKCRWVI